MGNVNAIPVVSQCKSLVQVIGGDSEGARETQEKFSKQCPVVSQTRSCVEAISGDDEAARRTQLEFAHNLEAVADGIPAVGHIKGGIHYALGDKKKGDECMKSASRTTAVVLAGVATGGAGGVVAGVAAATAGVAADGVTTGIDSAVHNEYRPNGLIQAGHTVASSRKPGDVFDFYATPISDGLGCKGGTGLVTAARAKAWGKVAKLATEEVAIGASPASPPSPKGGASQRRFQRRFQQPGTPFDVEVGPIWDQRDARTKANRYIQDHPRYEWTGHWRTTIPGSMSVIQVRRRGGVVR